MPVNFPCGILFFMGTPFTGSDHANLSIAVNTTVGFTQFTQIWNILQKAVAALENWGVDVVQTENMFTNLK